MVHRIAVIVGSIRRESINRKLAVALAKLAEGKLDLEILRIDDLPLFSQDDEANPTPAVTRFKEAVKAADGLLFVTPEHNRSIPAAMKNAIDWATRPPGQSAFRGKVGAVTGTSKGKISTAIAQQHLLTILHGHLAALLGNPEAYVQYADDLIDETGVIADEATRKFLTTFIDNFARLVGAMARS
jgi:chromate reductase